MRVLGAEGTALHTRMDLSPEADVSEQQQVIAEHPDFFWLIASRFAINLGFYSATEFLLYYVSDTLRARVSSVTSSSRICR